MKFLKKNKVLFSKSFLAGVAISLGGLASLTQDNKFIGSFLFTIGLFSVVFFELSLYTGKIGNLNRHNIGEMIITLIFNVLGCLFMGVLAYYAYPSIVEKAKVLIENKENISIYQTFFSSMMCGILMYIAVTSYKSGKNAIVSIALPVMVFINSGFDHSIANSFYMSVCLNFTYLPYLGICVLGNTVGAVFFRILANVKDKK